MVELLRLFTPVFSSETVAGFQRRDIGLLPLPTGRIVARDFLAV